MKNQKWNLAPGDVTGEETLAQEGIPALTARILCARGATTGALAARFLEKGEELLQDPMGMKDMDKAVARIEKALRDGEKIAVFGDYDVDGITSTCLLTHYLRGRGGYVRPYIPNRLDEGYGISREAVAFLHEKGITLMVTVDCGITAVEETQYAAELGMDVVITDHHECKDVLPPAVAVVDPHRRDCDYPFTELAGVGVALKLVMALGGTAQFTEYVDLAAIGTVADVMQITGENRAIVAIGLAQLCPSKRPGLRALLREAGVEGKPVTTVTIGYSLAPRLNAAGRMGQAEVAARLILTEDEGQAQGLAQQLCDLNRERQSVEGGICEGCMEALDREPSLAQYAIVMSGSDWHQGVVGIVASRLAEKYGAPAFMICVQDGKGKGSCRSYGNLNLFEALEACSDLLLGFGGHALAAGFTILEENIPAFREKMKDYVKNHQDTGGSFAGLEVDAVLPDASLLNEKEIVALDVLEPHGTGNPKPVLAILGGRVTYLSEVGGGRHLKLKVRVGSCLLDAIYFSTNLADTELTVGDKVDVAFSPQINEFRGNRTVQMQICDVRRAGA
ncbi:MAG: single-stranded-DNA-specific exonuclease RecJ [Oscillospiraceae bacterium]